MWFDIYLLLCVLSCILLDGKEVVESPSGLLMSLKGSFII